MQQTIEFLLLHAVVFYDLYLGINPDFSDQKIEFDFHTQLTQMHTENREEIEETLRDYEGYMFTQMRMGKRYYDGYSMSYKDGSLTIVAYNRYSVNHCKEIELTNANH